LKEKKCKSFGLNILYTSVFFCMAAKIWAQALHLKKKYGKIREKNKGMLL
jgi:hypothetical protein